MITFQEIQRHVSEVLNSPPRPLRVILFGSHARGTPHVESDIDLVVVLDKEGKSNSYRNLVRNRVEISKRLRQLKRTHPVDILVYTKDEWEALRASKSSFIQRIEAEGLDIL
jgi:predicted nucleotidyltransferase